MADQIPYLPKEVQDAVLAGPAMAPPDGVTPNFENPPNENALAHGVMASCLVVATFCLVLRAYLAILLRRVKVTEGLILCAFGCYIGWTFCTYKIMGIIGYGVNQWNVILGDMIPLLYYVNMGGVFYSVVLPLLKVAILLEWMQTFASASRNYFWYICLALIALQTMFGIAVVVALNLVCIPFAASYDLTVAGKCFDKHNLEVTSATIHLFTDAVMVFLPQRVIWGLQMSIKRKLGVSIVFGLGLLAVVSAICRLQVTIAYANAADATSTLAPVVFWAFAEMTCGFVVSCMPSAPRLLHETRLMPKIKKMLGMHVTTAKGTDMSTSSTNNNRSNFSKPSTAIDKYEEIEDDVMMDDIRPGKSESTEELHRDGVPAGHAIVRTTQVTVKSTAPEEHNSTQPAAWHAGAPAHPTRDYYGGM